MSLALMKATPSLFTNATNMSWVLSDSGRWNEAPRDHTTLSCWIRSGSLFRLQTRDMAGQIAAPPAPDPVAVTRAEVCLLDRQLSEFDCLFFRGHCLLKGLVSIFQEPNVFEYSPRILERTLNRDLRWFPKKRARWGKRRHKSKVIVSGSITYGGNNRTLDTLLHF